MAKLRYSHTSVSSSFTDKPQASDNDPELSTGATGKLVVFHFRSVSLAVFSKYFNEIVTFFLIKNQPSVVLRHHHRLPAMEPFLPLLMAPFLEMSPSLEMPLRWRLSPASFPNTNL